LGPGLKTHPRRAIHYGKGSHLQNYGKVEASHGGLHSWSHELVGEAVVDGAAEGLLDDVVDGGHEVDDPVLDVFVGELPNLLVAKRTRFLE
jgi:hypothetical protein